MLEAIVLSGSEPAGILHVARLIRDGGVAVIPTDTVYGLSCSIYRKEAVDRVYRIKQRTLDKQVPVLIATAADLPLLVREIPRPAWSLISRFWPGPLTLVLPARDSAPEYIVSAAGLVAVRVPAGRACLELLQVVGEPLVGTSANVSSHPPATTADAAVMELGPLVDAVLADDKAVGVGIASTVVEVTETGATVHREGAVTLAQIRDTLGLRVDAVR